jgi:hypothetical protein
MTQSRPEPSLQEMAAKKLSHRGYAASERQVSGMAEAPAEAFGVPCRQPQANGASVPSALEPKQAGSL